MLMLSFVIPRRRWLWILLALGTALAVAIVLVASAIPLKSDTLRERIVASLSERLNSNVTIDELSLRLYPRLHAEGTGLLIEQKNRRDVPPLISIKKFEVDADLVGLLRKRVAHVQLMGLDISIPPGGVDGDDPDDRDDRTKPHRLHDGSKPMATSGAQTPDTPHANMEMARGVVIDTLESDNARLIIVPRKAGKTPKTWSIHKLKMHDVGVDEAMPFEATLTNAIPPGEIHTKGSFGPWYRDDPGRTPLAGAFTFANADLSVFKGIGGTLSSKGSFGGALNYIDVNGETETPDFVIEVGGHPFPLHTKYHTIVDGTNGDTLLDRIDATFLKSTVVAKGAVLDGPPGQKGRTVTLDINMPAARIEDIMRMAVKADKPPMTGALQLTTKFLLPPGDTDVADRLKLNGQFTMMHATFTNHDVQKRIVELSRRGRGKPEATGGSIASEFKGRFDLGNGRLDLKNLMFAVPGAQVRLAGHYALERETLAFKGNLLLDAKVSETVSGFKALLLKIADPLFARDGGGSRIPIKIEGTRNDPKFGLDMGRVFKRGN